MEKGQESAPPYPGPPMNYGGAGPQPGMYPQVPPPGGYQGGLWSLLTLLILQTLLLFSVNVFVHVTLVELKNRQFSLRSPYTSIYSTCIL